MNSYTYTAWIEGEKGTRTIVIYADGIRTAYRKAEEACDEGEFVRGVNEAVSGEANLV